MLRIFTNVDECSRRIEGPIDEYSQTCLKWPPLYKGHMSTVATFVCFPWVALIDRFDYNY